MGGASAVEVASIAKIGIGLAGVAQGVGGLASGNGGLSARGPPGSPSSPDFGLDLGVGEFLGEFFSPALQLAAQAGCDTCPDSRLDLLALLRSAFEIGAEAKESSRQRRSRQPRAALVTNEATVTQQQQAARGTGSLDRFLGRFSSCAGEALRENLQTLGTNLQRSVITGTTLGVGACAAIAIGEPHLLPLFPACAGLAAISTTGVFATASVANFNIGTVASLAGCAVGSIE